MPIDRTRITHQAEKLVLQGKIEAGIAQYEILVKDNPRDVNTMNKIGDLFSRLGRKKDAVEQFNHIGELYAEAGFFLKAIAIFKKITKLDPGNLEPLIRLAELYAQQGLGTEARAQYQLVAERLIRVGDGRRAADAYRSLVSLDPDNPQPKLALAEMLSRQGRSAEAAEQYLHAGKRLESAGKVKEAQEAFKKAMAAQPASAGVVTKLAGEAEARGDRDAAISMLREAASKPGSHADIWLQLGETYARAGRHSEAEQSFERVAQVEPARLEPPLHLARLRLSRGDAAPAFDAIGPHLEALARAGKGKEAVGVLDEILGLDDRHDGVIRALADLHALLKDGENAFQCRRRLMDLLIDRGDFDEALQVAEALVKLRPGDAGLVEKVAQLRLAQKRTLEPRASEQAVMTARAGEALVVDDSDDDWGGAAEPSSSRAETAAAVEDADLAAWADGLPEAPSLEPEDEDFIAEHMTEADVFVKYGLADRAVDQLKAVTARFPGHAPAHAKLKEIHLEDGNRDSARDAMVQVLKSHLAAGDQSAARDALEELRRFDPALGKGSPASGETPEAPDEPPPPELVAAAPSEEEAGAPRPEDLEEVDFYLAQGLRDEAVAALRRLAGTAGSHPDILARMKRAMALGGTGKQTPPRAAPRSPVPAVEADAEEFEIVAEEEPAPQESDSGARRPELRAAAAKTGAAQARPAAAQAPGSAAPAPPHAAGGGDDLFDLASEIDAALQASGDGEGPLVPGVEPEPEGHSLEEIVQAFKKGIEDQVGPEDFDTHYSLGIAYKEMGLLDEAIGEFQFAAKEPRLLVDCCSMLGLCFRDKGMAGLGVKWYRRGLESAAGRDEEKILAMRYDLAELLAGMGERREAMDIFTEVYGINSKFRDVATRIKDLQKSLPPE